MLAQPTNMPRQICIDDGLRQIAAIGKHLASRDDAAQQPDIVLLEHEAAAGVAAAGSRRLFIARTNCVLRDQSDALAGSQTAQALGLCDNIRIGHLGYARVRVSMLVGSPTSHVGLVARWQLQPKILIPQANGLDVFAKAAKENPNDI